ncbi:MAG: tetratricopeptide repeat protein [Gemmatimonadaceae bacterium]
MTVKARLGYARSMVAATVLFLGAAPVASAQATRTPNPNAPRLVVGTLRSSDKKLSVQASEELRSRFNADIPFRMLTVISSADYKTVVEQSGYPYDEALSSGDLGSLAKLLRTDEYVEGTVEKTATGFIIHASLTLTRDAGLTQPLPPAEGDRLARVASALSKSLQDARKQIDHEKKCNMLGRDNKPAEAIASARAGVAAYPQATLVRLCELNVRAGFKQAPDSIIAVSLEVLKYDPKSKVALAYAAQAYKDKGDQDQSTEMLVRLLATDPTNTRLVDEVVNALAASGKSEMAKPIIAQAIKDNPGDVRLMKLGFLIYLASKDVANGTALGEEMVKIDTSLADTTYFTKMVAAYDGDSAFQKAADIAAQGAAKFPTNTTILSMLGQEQLKTGQQQAAIATFRKILTIDPKAPSIRMLIARVFDELKQPDSAFAALREAKAAGEDGQAVGGYALNLGNKLFKLGQDALNKAQQTKTSEDYATAIAANKLVLPWVLFADSTLTAAENKNQAKFILGVAAFQISVAAVSDAPKTKSCELARMAAEYIMIANINLPAGGRFAPDAVTQLMPVVPQISNGADQMIKAYCK